MSDLAAAVHALGACFGHGVRVERVERAFAVPVGAQPPVQRVAAAHPRPVTVLSLPGGRARVLEQRAIALAASLQQHPAVRREAGAVGFDAVVLAAGVAQVAAATLVLRKTLRSHLDDAQSRYRGRPFPLRSPHAVPHVVPLIRPSALDGCLADVTAACNSLDRALHEEWAAHGDPTLRRDAAAVLEAGRADRDAVRGWVRSGAHVRVDPGSAHAASPAPGPLVAPLPTAPHSSPVHSAAPHTPRGSEPGGGWVAAPDSSAAAAAAAIEEGADGAGAVVSLGDLASAARRSWGVLRGQGSQPLPATSDWSAASAALPALSTPLIAREGTAIASPAPPPPPPPPPPPSYAEAVMHHWESGLDASPPNGAGLATHGAAGEGVVVASPAMPEHADTASYPLPPSRGDSGSSQRWPRPPGEDRALSLPGPRVSSPGPDSGTGDGDLWHSLQRGSSNEDAHSAADEDGEDHQQRQHEEEEEEEASATFASFVAHLQRAHAGAVEALQGGGEEAEGVREAILRAAEEIEGASAQSWEGASADPSMDRARAREQENGAKWGGAAGWGDNEGTERGGAWSVDEGTEGRSSAEGGRHHSRSPPERGPLSSIPQTDNAAPARQPFVSPVTRRQSAVRVGAPLPDATVETQARAQRGQRSRTPPVQRPEVARTAALLESLVEEIASGSSVLGDALATHTPAPVDMPKPGAELRRQHRYSVVLTPDTPAQRQAEERGAGPSPGLTARRSAPARASRADTLARGREKRSSWHLPRHAPGYSAGIPGLREPDLDRSALRDHLIRHLQQQLARSEQRAAASSPGAHRARKSQPRKGMERALTSGQRRVHARRMPPELQPLPRVPWHGHSARATRPVDVVREAAKDAPVAIMVSPHARARQRSLRVEENRARVRAVREEHRRWRVRAATLPS